MKLRTILQWAAGDTAYAKLQVHSRRWTNRRFATRQSAIQLRVGDFTLTAPSDHILTRVQSIQPLRDLAIGIAAGELAHKYPGETLIDIGSNIGDTAAMMATYSPSPKILVEPSDYYHRFLLENATRIPNIAQIHKVMVSAQTREEGVLVHRGGTAQFETIVGSGEWVDCKTLEQIADTQTRFIKIDTDGFDLPIIACSLDFLARRRPCLYYELYLTDANRLGLADDVICDLQEIGYTHFAVFDDVGLHLVSTTDVDELHTLNRYLFKVLTGPQERAPYNFDIFCTPLADADIFSAVTGFYKHC